MASGDSKKKALLYWVNTFVVWGSFIFIGVAYGADLDKKKKNAALGLLVASLTCYYVSEFLSSTRKYLSNRSNTGNIYEYMEKMFYTPMFKVMTIKCYHYEFKKTVNQDSSGKPQVKEEKVRVDTHSATERYYYISWRDISGKFDLDMSGGMGKQERPFVQLHLPLIMRLAEDGTKADFHYQKRSFIARNNWDTHYDFSEHLEIRGHNEHILVKVTDYNPPCFSTVWFTVFTFLTVVEFYKMHIDKYCIHQEFSVVKVVSARQDLNAPQFVEQFVTFAPCIMYMGNVRQFDGPMLLPQGELELPPAAPDNMPEDESTQQDSPQSIPGMNVGMKVDMGSPHGVPGMRVDVPGMKMDVKSPHGMPGMKMDMKVSGMEAGVLKMNMPNVNRGAAEINVKMPMMSMNMEAAGSEEMAEGATSAGAVGMNVEMSGMGLGMGMDTEGLGGAAEDEGGAGEGGDEETMAILGGAVKKANVNMGIGGMSMGVSTGRGPSVGVAMGGAAGGSTSMIIGMEPDEESKTSKSKEDVLVDKLQSDMGSAVNVALSAATGMNVKLPLSFGGKSDSNKDSGSGGGLVSSLKKSFLNFCDD